MTQHTTTLGDDLPKIITHVRDEILPAYLAIGPAGMFGASMIRQSLDAANKAMIEGDLVAIIAAYKELKEIQ